MTDGRVKNIIQLRCMGYDNNLFIIYCFKITHKSFKGRHGKKLVHQAFLNDFAGGGGVEKPIKHLTFSII